jgi:hypothetical protein
MVRIWHEPDGEFRKLFLMQDQTGTDGPHWLLIPQRWEEVENERTVTYSPMRTSWKLRIKAQKWDKKDPPKNYKTNLKEFMK